MKMRYVTAIRRARAAGSSAPPRRGRLPALFAAMAAAVALSGCVVVPARPVAVYHPVPVHPYAFVVY